ncbi:MAG: alpha/beta fold hydrolase [Natrialbaceae archaeon]|nr:alpha/beta fold hydrolase [Natrialbaceae archaeon]
MTTQMETDASLLEGVDATSIHRTVNGVRLHVVTAGPEDGPLVVLLHGFPDFWYGWHHQIPALVDAGYRVVVPDQRGYRSERGSTRTAGVRSGSTCDRHCDPHRHRGADSAHVIGHDWGAGVAWNLALRRPESVETLGILDAPSPRLPGHSHLESRQLARSWYMLGMPDTDRA